MVKMIKEATLASSWASWVTKEMEGNATILPHYLVHMWYRGLDDISNDRGEENDGQADVPHIHELLKSKEVVERLDHYFAKTPPSQQTMTPPKPTARTKVRDWEEVDSTDFSVDDCIDMMPIQCSVIFVSLFAHISIRIPGSGKDKENQFCLVPSGQPKFNSRKIPVETYLWKHPPVESNLINGIEEKTNLDWGTQAIFVVPYNISSAASTSNPESVAEAPISCVLESTDEVDAPQNDQKKNRFDGDLVGIAASYEEAVKAFDAVSVSNPLWYWSYRNLARSPFAKSFVSYFPPSTYNWLPIICCLKSTITFWPTIISLETVSQIRRFVQCR
jgi:hypothetical protein